MGRKPNALILQHFNRGAKLPDHSNRYEHTCKSCGEKFPKGRIDNLTAHLVKKCPALSLEDRQKALLELNNLPNLGHNAQNRNGNGNGNSELQMQGRTIDLPVNMGHLSALETLAEVSRQIGLPGEHSHASAATTSQHHPSSSNDLIVDRLELHEQYTLDNPPVSYEQRSARDKKAGSQKTIPRRPSLSNHDPPSNSHLVPSIEATPQQVAMAATSIAMAAADRFSSSLLDPQLLDENENFSRIEFMNREAMKDALAVENLGNFVFRGDGLHWEMPNETYSSVDQSGERVSGLEQQPPATGSHAFQSSHIQSTTSTPIATPTPIHEFSSEFGNGRKATRASYRARFDPDRRKQVQNIRKQGACIRCRLLKKSCSEGQPCEACSKIESARIWKGTCIRHRIAGEFKMFSCHLHIHLAHHEVCAAKAKNSLDASVITIEASHFPETKIFATFKTLEDHSESGLAENKVRLIDENDGDLPSKLQEYAQKMLSVFIEKEPSHFMSVVLSTAQNVAYNDPADNSLQAALNLWVAVLMLVDQMAWTFRLRHTLNEDSGESHIIEAQESSVHQLLCSQINGAIEKLAADLCRKVLVDIENRMFTLKHKGHFPTFLMGVIVANCVEKAMWLFTCWEQEDYISRWPLTDSPRKYCEQGITLMNIIGMLYRCRSISPLTYVRAGIIGSQDQVEFFEKLNLSYDQCKAQEDNSIFDKGESRCFELSLCGRLLLPEHQHHKQ